MASKWDDPEWAAEQRRKIAEGAARRKAERESLPHDPDPVEALYDKDGNLVEEVRPISVGFDVPTPYDNLKAELGQRAAANRFHDFDTSLTVMGEPSVSHEPYIDDAALDLLRRFYQATRLRNAAGGWQVGRCQACNVPHVRGRCVREPECPCHEIERYLEGLDASQSKVAG